GGYCRGVAGRDGGAVACPRAWDRGRFGGGSLSLAGRTRYTRRSDALFNRFDDHVRRLGVNTAPALAGDERFGRRCRRVDVRCQHRVHVFRYATLLVRDTRDPTALKRLWER